MFGLLRVSQARKSCIQALRPFLVRPHFLEPWPSTFWRDPYVMGFVTYVIASVSHMTSGGKLTTVQKGRVLIDTLKEVGGYSLEFMANVDTLTKAKDPAFLSGSRNAVKVVSYVLGQSELPNDPDVKAAVALASGSTLDGTVDRDAVNGAMIHLLFEQVVRKRLGV